MSKGFLSKIKDPSSVITPIDNGLRFPEVVDALIEKYENEICLFCRLVREEETSGDLLSRIRSPEFKAAQRMALLKIFRRAVSGVCDTEATKKIKSIPTQKFIEAYGHTFKPISKLREQFSDLRPEVLASLAVVLGEYDNRGQQGYVLTGQFFDWFEDKFANILTIHGPRGAGPDIELSNVLDGFAGSCPCDFVIKEASSQKVLAVGFARYDSTRGGAQSDDRTGGNTSKIYSIREFTGGVGELIKVVFLADGPGLTHRDTWNEACALDAIWDDNVRVITLKLAAERLTLEWLTGS